MCSFYLKSVSWVEVEIRFYWYVNFLVKFIWDYVLRMFFFSRVGLKEDYWEESKDGGWCGRKDVLMELKINWYVCGNRKNEGNRCWGEVNC